ncbi:MAG: hypothetical protein KDB98_09005, partial [Flavobacteriales bacterium]|nr:hypothetical protein [Flavobacteriales bacterium]
MSDSFDLLDQLGDAKKVESLKAKIEKQKSTDIVSKLDQIESEIDRAVADKRDPQEIVSGIIESNFETLNGDVDQTEQDLQELMLHLRGMLDSCGGEFSKLQELNAEELAWIEQAKKKLSEAENDLAGAKGMNNAWNILFGYKNSQIAKKEEGLAQSQTNLKDTEARANK